MTLGGGTNITREPRNGRTFEYLGEDPILAGTLVGNSMKCEQAEHVIGDIKHYAVNDQENGRNEVDVLIGKRAMRESDLLAFEIGVGIADPGAVMCSYNAVNGDFACENKYLLTDVLKKEWGFKGFVVSDWGGTHSTVKASAAGLDQRRTARRIFRRKTERSRRSRQSSRKPNSTIMSAASCAPNLPPASSIFRRRKASSMFSAASKPRAEIEESSAVLLKNEKDILPLKASR